MPDVSPHSLTVQTPVPSQRRPSVSSTTIPTPTDSAVSVDRVPSFPIEIDHDNLLAGVATVIDSVFPDWRVDTDCKLVQCTNGITNKLVRCTHIPTGVSVLVRTYGRGSGVLIDRRQELVNMLALSLAGKCPPLYARFENGIVYGFTPGEVFSVQDMSHPHKSQLVARHLAAWHKVPLPVEPAPRLFSTLWRWLDAVPARYSSDAKAAKFAASGVSLDKLRIELTKLQKHLEALDSPVVFCHCDLLSGNIIYSPETDSVNFIDYEYGCYSFRGFDIGNHFCEWAGFDCDWSLYPSEQQQKTWLRAYHAEATGKQPTDAQLTALHHEALKFSLAAHFFWAVWALVQAEISDLDFDYLEYAVMRLAEFDRRKEAWLAL
ncbi:hypothetical protein HK105_205378 [Polyrhizophydium stewartii]|uniref:ethanolamine kinase n=1 Tax=Polyrhizophydium stewartii TaxID=2732419 RepID=A0ABR4N6A5_9FUNG